MKISNLSAATVCHFATTKFNDDEDLAAARRLYIGVAAAAAPHQLIVLVPPAINAISSASLNCSSMPIATLLPALATPTW